MTLYWRSNITTQLATSRPTHHNERVRVGHHGDEEVQQNDDIDDVVGAEHEHTPEPRERLNSSQFEVDQVHQPEGSPEKRL